MGGSRRVSEQHLKLALRGRSSEAIVPRERGFFGRVGGEQGGETQGSAHGKGGPYRRRRWPVPPTRPCAPWTPAQSVRPERSHDGEKKGHEGGGGRGSDVGAPPLLPTMHTRGNQRRRQSGHPALQPQDAPLPHSQPCRVRGAQTAPSAASARASSWLHSGVSGGLPAPPAYLHGSLRLLAAKVRHEAHATRVALSRGVVQASGGSQAVEVTVGRRHRCWV